MHAVDVNFGAKLKSLGCKISPLDVTSQESINNFKQQYGDGPLDLLLNVAGNYANSHPAWISRWT